MNNAAKNTRMALKDQINQNVGFYIYNREFVFFSGIIGRPQAFNRFQIIPVCNRPVLQSKKYKYAKNEFDFLNYDLLFNLDGSTYIIEDADQGDLELPKQEGCFVEDAKEASEAEEKSYPQTTNAFVVSRSTAYYNALYGQAFVKLLQDRNVPETPVVHSYRVYSVRNRASQESTVTNKEPPTEKPTLPTLVPVKPILMCFICKLSFGCAKSFASHCGDSHSLGN